jgi:nicotinic acid phosphoribosyltransferase
VEIKVTKEFQLNGLPGVRFQSGNVMEVSDGVGQKWIKAGVAAEVVPVKVEAVEIESGIETASIQPGENTMIKPPAAKKVAQKKK